MEEDANAVSVVTSFLALRRRPTMLNHQLPRSWAITVFMLTLAVAGFSALLLISGHGSVPSLLIGLAAACTAAIPVFQIRWSALVFYGLFFAFALSAVCVALWTFR
jgi:hypothetical protein